MFLLYIRKCYEGSVASVFTNSVVGVSQLVVRMVDDFLLVTSDEDVAREFFCLMDCGIPKFNCQFNRAKTQATFDVDDNDGELLPNHNSEYMGDLSCFLHNYEQLQCAQDIQLEL